MPSSAVRSFSDPDDFAASIRATRYELTITAPGQFAGELVRIDLHDLWMQRFSTNLSWISNAANLAGRAIFVFRTEAGPALTRGAIEMRPSVIERVADAQITYQRASGPVAWGSMSLPLNVVAGLRGAMARTDLTPPRDMVTVAPSAAAIGRLQRLHAAAGHLARHAPEIIANSAAAHGLEQELIQAMIACVGPTGQEEDKAGKRRHAAVMRKFREAVRANKDAPIYVSELCSTLGVSDRTLRACCQEHLGMGPIRYLWLRRMQNARRALGLADAASATVTDIATAHGFWELGRFAVAYRDLYGESPSETLRRIPDAG